MRCAVSSPSAVDGQEHFRQVLPERRLLFRREHQVAVALLLVRQRRKNFPSHAKVYGTKVRALFHPFQAQCNPPKILRVHRCNSSTSSRVSKAIPNGCYNKGRISVSRGVLQCALCFASLYFP